MYPGKDPLRPDREHEVQAILAILNLLYSPVIG
jgi:hypothetical protein